MDVVLNCYTMSAHAVEDWLRIRRELLEMESNFTQMAIRVTEGLESQEVLATNRQVLEATRALCAAAFERAFPGGLSH